MDELLFINNAIQYRADYLDWYVLKYDVKTGAYNNEIVFKTYKEAFEEYGKTKSSYSDERIELIFSPTEDDEEFGDNILIKSKF